MSTAALFIAAKEWKQPKCSWRDEWVNKCGICMQWTVMQPLKETTVLMYATTGKTLKTLC